MLRIQTLVIALVGCFLPLAVPQPQLTGVYNRGIASAPKTTPPLVSPLGTQGSGSEVLQTTNHAYGKLSIYFEPNFGQTESRVKFIARSGGVTMLLTPTEAVFALPIADWRLPIEYTGQEQLRSELNFGLLAFDRGLLNRPSVLPHPKSAIANRQSPITMRSAIT